MANRQFQKGGLFNGAKPLLLARAKELRDTMTEAESVLWYHLKGGIGGLKFRRQHPLGCYIADFYCHKAKLVIEIDGSIHQLEDEKKQDEQKEKDFKADGYMVLRFSNKQVMRNTEEVICKIKLALKNFLNNNH